LKYRHLVAAWVDIPTVWHILMLLFTCVTFVWN